MNKNNKLIVAIVAALCLVTVLVAALIYAKPQESSGAPAVSTVKPAAPADNTGMGMVVINEFMEKNRTVITDSCGEFSDWIELKNISGEEVELTGWMLGDEPDDAWIMPEIRLPAGETLLIFASGRDKTDGELHSDFSLSGNETVFLRNASGTVIDKVPCQDCAADISVARTENGDCIQSKYPTPGYENNAEGYDRFQQTLAAAGPLCINEVMVSNREVFGDYLHGYEDWVEIKNISDAPVSLADYYLSDSHKDYFMWQLPERQLAPGELMIILCDGRDDRADELPGASFSLNSSNEQLFLSNRDGIVDRAALRDIPDEGSFGRMDGENGWFFFAMPSPGKDNSDGARRISAKPETLTKDGVYNKVDSVKVELSGKGEIYYTLDGSVPTKESAVYTEALELTKTTVLRAISIEENALPSRPLTLTYIINENHTVPVLSLATDSPYNFDGMYWGMQKGVELPASLSLYELDGTGFTIGCGLSMNGETSLELPKKNMSVRFRGCYGDETLKYDIYGGGVTEFTNLLLRSGQDYPRAIVRNELCQELCAQATDKVINQRSIWCVLYINGEYFGLYTLKEKANEQLYASLAGVSRDSVELVEASAPYDSELYQNVMKFCVMNDMRLKENYDYICSQMDIDSLIDWVIMESFCANVDLTEGNLRYVRSSENDGKWRFMFYDLDSTFDTVAGGFVNHMSDFAYETRQYALITYNLMANEEYKDKFLTRAAELFSTVLTEENVEKELNHQCDIIKDEVARDYGRFTRTVKDWEWNRENLLYFLTGAEYESTSWRQYNIDTLSRLFDLSSAERAHYFGEIDRK